VPRPQAVLSCHRCYRRQQVQGGRQPRPELHPRQDRKIDARQRQIEQSIQRYLDALETADRTQRTEVEGKTERLTEKIKKLREQMKQLDDTKEQLKR
jgi:predicted ribosome quality control (RQC) complex YloA/Tae2 family protein